MKKEEKKTNIKISRKNPLKITKDEKIAMIVYGGIHPKTRKYKVISDDINAYGMINAMFFEGIDNELIRIFDDDKIINSRLIQAADEMMDVILNLYSAMYKYGKAMEDEEIGYRIERTDSINRIKEKGTTISNTSTSSKKYNFRLFDKYDISLIEAHVKPGTPCINYQKILSRDEYKNYSEGEILIAPFCPVEIEEMEEIRGYPRYKVTVSAPEKAKPLTPEEEADKERQTGIYKNKILKDNASSAIGRMTGFWRTRYSCEDDKKRIIEEIEEIEEYIKWKSAFLAVIRYRFREIELEIDAALEANKNKKQKISGFKKDILEKTIYKVVKGMKSITSRKSKNDKQQYEATDILGLSEQGIEMMNSEAVGEIFKTTVATGKKKTRTENNSIEEV